MEIYREIRWYEGYLKNNNRFKQMSHYKVKNRDNGREEFVDKINYKITIGDIQINDTNEALLFNSSVHFYMPITLWRFNGFT